MSLTSPFLRHALTLVVGAALVTACGGGGGQSATQGTTAATATPASYSLQTYITDNLATEYAKVWVTISKISAVDASGAEVSLFDASASPVTVNLSSLANVGQFMSTVTLPAGLYSQIKVTLGNAVQLVSLDGATTTAAKFSASGSSFVWTLREVQLDPSSSGQLVLDFNLARFSYDASTGIVTPVIEHPASGDAFGKFVRQQAEVHGTVTAVNVSAGSFTVNDARLGSAVVVTLASDATLVNEQTHATLTLAALAIGAKVEVKGTVTPGATTADPSTVTTSVVHVLPADTGSTRLTGKGTVKAIAGQKVTVALQDANFLPSSNSVVVDISSARFAHGQASDLAVGLSVQFSGQASGSGAAAVVQATVFNIDGAPSDGERSGRPDLRFTGGLVGDVVTVTSTTAFTVKVSTANAFAAVGTYTVDASKVVYETGTAACLVAGAHVQVRGTLSGSTVTAQQIEIAGCAGQSHAAPGKH